MLAGGSVFHARSQHQVQLAAYRAHPERFVNGPPRLQKIEEAVWINPPEKTTHQDAAGTTQTEPDDLKVVVPAINTYEPLTRSEALRPRAESGWALYTWPGTASESLARAAPLPIDHARALQDRSLH